MARDRVVIDSGFILEAILPTTADSRDDALALIDAIAAGELKGVVPWIFHCELAAVCAKATRSRRITKEEAADFLDSVQDLGLDLDMQIDPPSILFANAMRTGAQAYDTIYLMLAASMDLPLATIDRGMRTGARSMKIPLYEA